MEMKKIVLAVSLLPVFLGSAYAENTASDSVLTFNIAKEIKEKAEKIIVNHHIGGAIAVVDASGKLIAFDKLDGATLANGELAGKKAYTAAAFGVSTETFQEKLMKGNMSILGNPEIVPLPGGVPIVINNKVVGAIGVSTPVGSVDLEAAKAAVDGI